MVIKTIDPTVKLELTDDAIVLRSGIIGRTKRKILYAQINSIKVQKRPFVNFGNITVYAGNDTAGWKSPMIRNPERVEDLISEKIKSVKIQSSGSG